MENEQKGARLIDWIMDINGFTDRDCFNSTDKENDEGRLGIRSGTIERSMEEREVRGRGERGRKTGRKYHA